MYSKIDPVFAEMEFKYSWRKKDKDAVNFLGRNCPVEVLVKAYDPNDEILEQQRKMYEYFKKNASNIFLEAVPEFVSYCETSFGLKGLSVDDITKSLTPKCAIFQRNGTWGVLFDCVWDEEHGIALYFSNQAMHVGPQDVFI